MSEKRNEAEELNESVSPVNAETVGTDINQATAPGTPGTDTAEDAKRARYNKQMKALDTITTIIMLLVCVGVVVFRLTVNPIRVTGDSMLPTYTDGTLLASDKNVTPEKLTYGTVVVFKGEETNKAYYVKRVIALPGDTIWIQDGQVYVNGNVSEFNYEEIHRAGILENNPLTLGDDEYFLMGDNRNNSNDSRNFGPVSISEIKYIATKALFQFSGKGNQ